jgi:hypothetical protein
MSDDYFDIAWIHGERKAILHGKREDGTEVERELTMEERKRFFALDAKHQAERYRLLREFAA